MAIVEQYSAKSVIEGTKKLYRDEKTADVHFVFKNNGDIIRFPAHKIILASCSPVFHTMFYSAPLSESDVKINDASPKGFMDFLALCYLDEVKITNENVTEFIDLAHKYHMPEGLKIGEQFLLKYTTVANLFTHYALAVKFNLNDLRNHCESEFRVNAVKVFKTDSFINCSKQMLDFILKLNSIQTFNCFEVDIFNACMNWAKNACKKDDIDGTDQQQLRCILGESFYLIPFSTMNADTLSEIVYSHPTLFSQAEAFDMMVLATTGKSTELTKKYLKRNDDVQLFSWDDERLEKHIRIFEPGTCIGSVEYTTFSSRQKILFGGFSFFDFKNKSDSHQNLFATVTITRLNDTKDELLENHQLRLYADKNQSTPFEIKLKNPLVIMPHVKHTICVNFYNCTISDTNLLQHWSCDNSSENIESTDIYNDDGIEFYENLNSLGAGIFTIISTLYFNRL